MSTYYFVKRHYCVRLLKFNYQAGSLEREIPEPLGNRKKFEAALRKVADIEPVEGDELSKSEIIAA